MGAMVGSHTGCAPGVLNTLTRIPGHEPVRPRSRSLAGGRGRETDNVLLAILYLREGQKSSSEHVEIVALALHDLCEIPSCQGLKVLMHIHGTFGMFRTF
jgi:hypothetical protein